MNYRFKAKDCPDANGRVPLKNERKWKLRFPLDDGGELTIEIGKTGWNALKEMLAQEAADDAAEGVEI
jgi:hypothetical protein